MVPVDELEERTARRTKRFLAVLVPAIAFIGLLAFGLLKTTPEVGAGSAGPEFELPLLSEQGALTSKDLKGKPVVVNFWASWCVPCREEAPLLERAWRAYRDEGVVVLGVNIQDAESDAKAFVREFDITYPIVRDTEQTLARDFGVRGIPETFFMDQEWRFVGTVAGAVQDEQQGTVVLGAISEEELITSIEILLRGLDESSERRP